MVPIIVALLMCVIAFVLGWCAGAVHEQFVRSADEESLSD